MEKAGDALSLARIAGNIGFAGLTLIGFSPLLAGFFLFFDRIFRNLEQSFMPSSKSSCACFPS
jgi:hypothetical protein